MLLPQSLMATLIVMIFGMLCLGTWAITYKLSGNWRFELYYFDFAFGVLVESGLVAAGSTLTDAKRRWSASVRADGSIASGSHAGSIHKVGAALQNAPSCNGWTFWHVEQGGTLTVLDALRQEHLSSL